MDIISHGLWGGVAFGRQSRKKYWQAFLFGVLPDLLSFGILRVATFLGFSERLDFSRGTPAASLVPPYVHTLYDWTHSLVIFAIVFGLVWLFRKRPWWVMGAWALHILVDIPSHSDRFFPTPFLWPISDFHVNGISWGNPIIFFPNLILLAATYGAWFFVRRRKHQKQ